MIQPTANGSVVNGNRLPEPGFAASVDPGLAGKLGAALLSSFRRRDQRAKAEQYLWGLLTAPGRKSIRNIAAHVGGPATEQNLHHFITSSTWDWWPLRVALSEYLHQASPTQARVVRSVPIRKSGGHSVGVGRQFDPQQERTFHGQQAFSVWSVSAAACAPINWRLFLPDPWLAESDRRDRAKVPKETVGESVRDCAVSAVLEAPVHQGNRHTPVLLNLLDGTPGGPMARLAAAGIPVVAQIRGSCRLTVEDYRLPGHRAGPLAAQEILDSVRSLRTPVETREDAQAPTPLVVLAAMIRVGLPHPPFARRRPMLLLGEWHDARQTPIRMWLTDIIDISLTRLFGLTTVVRRVHREFAEIGTRVGLCDYFGRCFQGWHRHLTLASAAHAVISLSEGRNRSGDDRDRDHAVLSPGD